ncbi:MAG: BatA domain-containing protein, partial [Tepidisphaeraceae bacterium]
MQFSPILAAAFVTPAFFIAGAALVAIPIVIHILNRRRFKTVPWAAMEFLLRALRKNRRRLQFEQWVLLATRCLVLFLLGMALARPLACSDQGLAGLAQRSGLHVFVIDNSYSMAYEAD